MKGDLAQLERDYYAVLKRGKKREAAIIILRITLEACVMADRDGIEPELNAFLPEFETSLEAQRVARDVADL